MGYTIDSGMVRVDYFKPSGKWYMTEAIDMSPWYDYSDIYVAVERALDNSRPERNSGWWSQFTVVVLKPYHKNAYPIMIVSEDAE